MNAQQDKDVITLRAFNRVYTRQLGLLDDHLDQSPFTLSEARVLYELAHRDGPTAAELCRALGLDPAQMSRTLKRFDDRGLLATQDDPEHRKHQLLSLTEGGRAAFAALDANTRAAVGGLLARLPAYQRGLLLTAAETISGIFDNGASTKPHLRGLRPGDLGLVTARQAIFYAREFGWNAEYEVLVADILVDFQRRFDALRDAAWIAEWNGQMVGSIFLVHSETPKVAKLRLLYVEPDARGAGIGRMLVDACIEEARKLGYDRLTLWTNSVLTAARRIYERAGFQLISEEAHHSFGHHLIGQTWSLELHQLSDHEVAVRTSGRAD